MNKLPRLFPDAQVRSCAAQDILSLDEIRLIEEGTVERLEAFVASERVNAADSDGNTPLHIAARTGNLPLCDLFIRGGADPNSLNRDQKTPAELAGEFGHLLLGRLLKSFVLAQPEAPSGEAKADRSTAIDVRISTPLLARDTASLVGGDAATNELDELPRFEAEEAAEEFFQRTDGRAPSVELIAQVIPGTLVTIEEAGSWELDTSPSSILGEGIRSDVVAQPVQAQGDHDFLKVRHRGRQSTRQAVVQAGTHLSIPYNYCKAWSDDVIAKGHARTSDIEALITECRGNGDFCDLFVSLRRNIEASGLSVLDGEETSSDCLWDAATELDGTELAELVQAVLTRATQLPGTQRFIMDTNDERRLTGQLTRARQSLDLCVLASDTAMRLVLSIFARVIEGSIEPRSLTARSLKLLQRSDPETEGFIKAGESLKAWTANGRVMHGKDRREALAAIETLELTVEFQHALTSLMSKHEQFLDDANQIRSALSSYEEISERFLLEHLPYARRFASRNVGIDEDPEDVFQVTFIGLQRAIRRFDPERGYRFLIYATYWMRQGLLRWRADEGSAIRVPVHRQEDLARLDDAAERLDIRFDGNLSHQTLAAELSLPVEHVKRLRDIPRLPIYIDASDDWDFIFVPEGTDDPTSQTEAVAIVESLLADLPERQADVIRMRFGIGRDAEMTLEEIGKLFGVTRERIRQIEAKALRTLSHPGRLRHLQAVLGR